MDQFGGIISLAQWLRTPLGCYLLDWEQEQLDLTVVDIFGFHALQLGFPELEALRANRMPYRWLAADHTFMPDALHEVPTDFEVSRPAAVILQCDFDALPFDSHSLDLVVLPHSLELARDPHQALREVERVLRPEGRAVILGFNPGSLWGLRQSMGRLIRHMVSGGRGSLLLPTEGELIGYWRLRDWLRLLSFDIEVGKFGCYRPALASETWLARFSWMDRAGKRWWPVLGAVYLVVAVKRVRGMRLIGLVRRPRATAKATRAAISQRHI